MSKSEQEQEIREVLAHYFSDTTAWQLRDAGDAGWNNTTRFVDTEDGAYVVRVYQNENTLSVLQFEHELLDKVADKELSFRTPRLIRTRSGSTYAETSSGKYGALFACIEGEHPNKDEITHVWAIGAAIAELSVALIAIELTHQSAYSGYHEIYKTHPLVTRESLATFFADPVIGFDQDQAQWAQQALQECEREIEQFRHLPQGLIHGDVTVGNTLMVGSQVSGILDFEFAARDFRAMEMAVFFVGLLGDEEVHFARMEAFLKGYGSVLKWSLDEITALPLFLKLRKLCNFLHLIGRWMGGLNSLEDVVNKLEESKQTERWLTENRERLFSLCEIYLLP